ncbi:hypothetical protein J2S43_004480 [Catenuloplanes nepalensis]|uniref:DUF4262 domain-containing protein n=1 Tax=Catenuloplanes nepalensis TaxID=587533 RepID=A0ABT9MX00_9ACTN|nr:DUF4262 domain-containing protein [Catenuloplanes nepalensis]MDP9795968.1 hypothetical protein [Catenuloplanes nepalensis]
MDDQSCYCLLCAAPPSYPEESWDLRDDITAGRIRRYGWNVTGVTGGPAPDWAYSTGLWHTHRAPEICVFGVPGRTGQRIINQVGNMLRDGVTLTDGERHDDVLTGYDVVVRAVRAPWYRRFFGAGLDFCQRPAPMMQIVWPDRAGRFPWEPETDPPYRDVQPRLWMLPDDHPPDQWTRLDPTGGWPFRGALPFHQVHASPAVVAGTAPIGTVLRDEDGTWRFLEAGASAEAATGRVALRRLTKTHPDVLGVADLEPGARATRGPDGTWIR